MVEDVWDCYGTRSEPLPSVEDVWDCYGTRSEPLPGMEWWKTSETATALGRNHYQVWIGGRRKRLLRHSVRTTTKHGDGRSGLLRSFTGLRWLGKKAGWFQRECLRPMTSTNPTKRNLVMIETSQWGDWMVEVERINSRGISHSDR